MERCEGRACLLHTPSPAPHLWWSWAPRHPSLCRGNHFSLSRLSSSPGSQPLPAQLTSAFRGNQNPQEKMDRQPCPPLKPKQVYMDARPLPMLPGEGRQHLAPRRGPPPHRLLKGRLRFPLGTLQGAQISPQRPLPVTRVRTLKPPRAPRPAPPCPVQTVPKLRAQFCRPTGAPQAPCTRPQPPPHLHSCPGPGDTRSGPR